MELLCVRAYMYCMYTLQSFVKAKKKVWGDPTTPLEYSFREWNLVIYLFGRCRKDSDRLRSYSLSSPTLYGLFKLMIFSTLIQRKETLKCFSPVFVSLRLSLVKVKRTLSSAFKFPLKRSCKIVLKYLGVKDVCSVRN